MKITTALGIVVRKTIEEKPMKRELSSLLVLGTILGLASFLVASPSWSQVSSFDNSNEGWQTVEFRHNYPNITSGPRSVEYRASGGNTSGYIHGYECGWDGWYWQAPSLFLGNKASSYGSLLEYDRKEFVGNSRFLGDNQDGDVVLVGDTGTGYTALVYGRTPECPLDWTHYEVPLYAGQWTLGWNGAVASEMEVKSVLSNLRGLYILGEFSGGWDESGLDNVVMTSVPVQAVPEFPASMLAAFGGLSGLLWRRYKR